MVDRHWYAQICSARMHVQRESVVLFVKGGLPMTNASTQHKFVPEYCASMLSELRDLASQNNEPLLAHLIGLAAIEAKDVTRRQTTCSEPEG